MDAIKSIKNYIFDQNDNNNKKQNINKTKNISLNDYNSKDYYKYLFKLNYKREIKSNNKSINLSIINFYKKKEEKLSDLKIKVNRCLKKEKATANSYIKDNKYKTILKKTTLSPINKSKLQLDDVNISYFYILKGAIFIIEDWWKKVLIHKIQNKNLLKRNINSKNYELFSNKKNYKSKNNSAHIQKNNLNINNMKANYINKNKLNKISKFLIYDKDIENKNNKKQIFKNNKESTFNSNDSINIKPKNKIKDSFENEKESYLEDTVINGDSCYIEFNDNKKKENNSLNKEKQKINKIMEFDEEIRKRKIYSLDKINDNKKNTDKDNIDTKRENSIIYPMNKIEHLLIEDICSNLDKHLNKNKEKEDYIIDFYNSKNNNMKKVLNKKKSNNYNNINIFNDSSDRNNKDIEINKASIAWEDPNTNMTPFISIEQNNELFNEIKSKIKVNLKNINDEKESELLIKNNFLLRENPLNDSSIYIRNSDISQNELIRNVNIHIINTKTKEATNNFKNKLLNNSNNSNTIHLEDDDYGFSELINISDCKNDDAQTSSFYNSIYNNDNLEKDKKSKKIIINNQSKKKYENIYKN